MVSARSETGMMATRYYYALGRSTGYAINGTRQTTIAYDSFGRIATMSVPSGQSNNPNNRTIEQFSWAYLPGSDLKASLQYPNGLTASWTYDANNQLLQVCNAMPTNVISQFDYTYDAAGRRVSIVKSGNAFGDLSGSVDAYTYNTRSELTSARRTKNGQPIPGFSEDFDYDPIGNRRSSATYNEKGEAQTSTYQANNLNQYTSRTTPGYAAVRGEADPNAFVSINGNEAYRLGSYYYGSDLFDNSTAGGLANLETYATLAQTAANGDESEDLVSTTTNQVYIAQSPETFAYDDDGNQTLITTKTGLWRVTYNGENRPVRWELVSPDSNTSDSNTQTLLQMAYDHMGRRREKNTQRFFYDGYLQIAEFTTAISNSSFLLRNSYVWDPTEPVATRPLAWTTPTTDHESPITNFYTHDGNKNVSEVFAFGGSLAAHYEYAPFGALILQRGTSASINPWRFSSEYAERDTATVYYNYRCYDPVIGRWLSRDPTMERASACLYAFNKNFVMAFDYLGRVKVNLVTKKVDRGLWDKVFGASGTLMTKPVGSVEDIYVFDQDDESRPDDTNPSGRAQEPVQWLLGMAGLLECAQVGEDLIVQGCDIEISMSIVLSKNLGKGSKRVTYIYQEHKGTNGGALGYQRADSTMFDASVIPRDAVLAHERGHAKEYISFIGEFANDVKDMNIDKLDMIRKKFSQAYLDNQNRIFEAANEPTKNWFSNHGYKLEVNGK